MTKKQKDRAFWATTAAVCALAGGIAISRIAKSFSAKDAVNFLGGQGLNELASNTGAVINVVKDSIDDGVLDEIKDDWTSMINEDEDASGGLSEWDDFKDELNSEIGNLKDELGDDEETSSTSSDTSLDSPEQPVLNATGTLVRVVDGDTYVLNIDGVDTKVRLIGIDTPECVAPEEYYKENTEAGVMVSQIVKDNILAGSTLGIEYDIGRTDKYGRTLAYLYFDTGLMVQDWLLSNGYAQVMTIQPNSKYAEHFVEIEQQAMANKVGIWSE